MKTINELYIEALEIQNACNLCGLAQRFAQVMKELNTLIPSGTTERNRHSIVSLWLDKFNSLNGIQFDNGSYDGKLSEAYREAFAMKGNE